MMESAGEQSVASIMLVDSAAQLNRAVAHGLLSGRPHVQLYESLR